MSQVNEAMQTLTAQWYNAMVTGLGLSNQSFQLYQGSNSMVETSQSMWNIFNAVPPTAVNNYYDPAQLNNLTSDYSLILDALLASPDTNFKLCMGDYYDKWIHYLNDNMPKTLSAESLTNLFNQWAITVAPEKASCVAALTKVYINPINIANLMFLDADGHYAWNQAFEALKKSLNHGAEKSFKLESASASSDVSHTWAKVTASVLFNLFSLNVGYDKLSNKTTTAGIKISASFERVTTFVAGPYTQYDPNDPTLKTFKPWYNSAALSLAYTTKGDKVWNPAKPTTWETMFGTKGSLQRITTALVVADDIKIVMNSKATYDSSEQTEIKAAVEMGIWPFFKASGSGGFHNDVKFHDDGSFIITITIDKDNPQILGILQTPMSNVF